MKHRNALLSLALMACSGSSHAGDFTFSTPFSRLIDYTRLEAKAVEWKAGGADGLFASSGGSTPTPADLKQLAWVHPIAQQGNDALRQIRQDSVALMQWPALEFASLEAARPHAEPTLFAHTYQSPTESRPYPNDLGAALAYAGGTSKQVQNQP